MAKLSTSTVFGDLLVDGTIYGNVTGNLTGNASTATTATTATTANTLTTARTIALGGLLSGSASFNGSGNITINAANAKPPKSGDWWSGGIPIVQTDGVMEVGKYIDFHNSDTSTNDYDVRLQSTTAGPVMVNLPSASGTIARVEDNVASATKLKDARTITIGNKGNSFDGTANISYSLSDIGAAPTSHNHNTFTALTGTSWTTATRDIQTDCVFEFSSHISKSATGLFPVDNNANAMISFNRHSGPHASQLGFSSNGKIYYRFGNATAITDSTAWQQIYTSTNKPSLTDLGAAASSHGTHVTYSSTAPKVAGTASAGSESAVARGDHVHAAQTSVSGNAGTATTLQTARTLTIGATGKSFNGSANVSWSLAEIGAAAIADAAQSWNAVIKCATWSRLFWFEGTTTVGGSYLVNIRGTRSNIVHNATFVVNFSHATKCFITQINNTDYSNFKVRAVVTSGMGQGYFEMYDDANSATNATSQTINVTVTSTSGGTKFTKYTAFTDGTTIPSNYSAVSELTTVSGSYYSGKAATAANAEILKTARNIQIGNKTNSFNGSANITYSLTDIGALPTAGGTMTGNIKFADVTSTTYPAKSAMLTWNGSTDGADIYYQVDASDKGRLVLNTRDDSDCIIVFANKGTSKATIDTSGNFSGKAATAGSADKLATARTLTIGSTGKTFDGSANVSWTLTEIGAAASSHSHTSINYQDTRSVNTTPADVPNGLSIHLKSNGADGISDGGSYHPVFMMKPWGDKSGWPIGQLTMTQNNNLYFRVSAGSSDTTWNEWKKVSLDGHTHGGTITAVNSNFSNATITNYDTVMAGINTNIGKL